MSFKDDAGDFTMVSHALAKEVGLVCAVVYGAIWRYCKRYDGVCNASLNTIGNDVSLDRATVMRNIEKLCSLGYLIDQTPGRRNAPHTYIIGRTVVMRNSLDVADDNRPQETVVVDNTTVAHNNSSMDSVAQNNATVAESHLKRVLDSSFKEEEKERHPDFAKVCQEYQYEIGGLSQSVSDTLDDDIKTYSAAWVIDAMKLAAKANIRRLDYVEGILKNWLAIGGPQNDKPKGNSKQNGAYKNGHQRTNKTGTDGGTLKPREMDGDSIRAIEDEIARLERQAGITGGNLAGATP